MDRCKQCQQGPTGIAGHERLFSQTMGTAEMHFRCAGCGTYWSRRNSDGGFAWAPTKKLEGSDTPGRPGTAPP